ncbi:hypothetical protein ACXVUM_13775 [Williamsia sp. SKLECPSW1]
MSPALSRRTLRTCLALLVGGLVAVTGAPGAPAVAEPSSSPGAPGTGLGIRLLEAPVSLEKDPRAQTYIVDNLPPGTTIERTFEVSNATGSPQQVSLYPGAATIPSGEGFTVQDGRATNELTSWMSVTPATITVPDRAARTATVRIAVPRDATETERYAVVWAEIRGAAPSGGGIVGVSRVGIRVYLSVGPGNGPPADFRLAAVTPGRAADGSPQVTVGIENVGRRALDPRGTVTLSDGPGGVSAAPVSGSGGSIAPGDRGTVTFPFDRALAAGPWKASVSVSSGVVTRDTSTTITFPGAAESSDSDGGTAWWVWVVAGVVIVAAVVVASVLLIRRRRSGT